MPDKLDFVDYAPLRNSKLEQESEPEEFGFRNSFSAETRNNEEEWKRTGKQSQEEAVVDREPKPLLETVSHPLPFLKRGHTLSFIGLFLFTMLVFIRPYELSPSLTWLSRGALITAILTLIAFVPTQLGLENKITIRPREVNCVLLLVLCCLLSIPLALDKFRAWGALVEYLKVVMMFIVLVNVVRTKGRLMALLNLIMFISLFLSLAAINDYRQGNLVLGGTRIAGVIGGLFENPNDLALHLVTLLPIVIGLALGSRLFIFRVMYLSSALLILGGTIVTFSRAGFLGLIFVFGALVWRLGRKNRFLVAVAIVVLLGAFLVAAPGAYRQRLATTRDDSAAARTGELKRSVFLTLRHPVFGLGMDNFVLYSDTSHATHNAYTQVSSEIGIFGAVVYVIFLVTALRRVRKLPKPDASKKEKLLPYLGIGLEASLIGYMVVSFFASVAYLWYVYYLVAYAICVSRLTAERQETPSTLETSSMHTPTTSPV